MLQEMPDFRPYTMSYLNDWCLYDRCFCDHMKNRRLAVLKDVLVYYRVIRGFAKKHERGVRFAPLLEILATEEKSIKSRDDAIDRVKGFTNLLNRHYRKELLSAASKLLWLIHKSPVVILDSRVAHSLKHSDTSKNTYEIYVKKWQEEFQRCQPGITKACDELVDEIPFSFAGTSCSVCSDGACRAHLRDEVQLLVKAGWFHERVFDKYHWMRGRKKS